MVIIDDMNENIPTEFESITNGNYINDINVNKKIKDITLHHDATTTKTNCLWQASFYFGKRTATIHLSKFNNVHNHQCDPVTIELAFKNQCFPQAMLDKIEHYTVNGHLSAEQQIYDKFNAKTMFLYFMEQHNKNHDFIVKIRLERPSNELTRFFWITSQQPLSLFVGIDSNFKTRILVQALTKYETLADYKWILQKLWAKYIIGKIFTAEIKSTQWVESINGVLKKHLDQDTLLKELRAQIKQALLYQGSLITIDQISKPDILKDIIEHMYDIPHFESTPPKTSNYVTIAQGNKTYSSKLVYYIDQIRSGNVYTSTVKKKIDKRIKFGNTISIVKTSVQIAVKVDNKNISEILNPKYHKPKGHPPKCYKSQMEMTNKQNITSSSKRCSYYLEKGHNIRSCAKNKALV
ncbi:hypothetical protein RhiirA1_452629 [Rhizophagus irregularis]|uniref:MULE transposase domain-containing protein n=1 Tax=Rhizophagus irregularis TaxID=588596 RepID=A0A2N0S9L2_9GLOM|nr:hypothetical protein RhiirA1_452629 [Rhizophagus irregularis]